MSYFSDSTCDRQNPDLNKFYDYLEKHNNQKWHTRRMGYSIDYIYPFIKDFFKKNKKCVILDLGNAEYIFTKALKDILNCEILFSKNNISYKNELNDNKSADIILCMEVIEHLPDINTYQNMEGQIFKYTGMKQMLENIVNYMKYESILFITTPNLCSYRCIGNLLNNIHPFNWIPHPRELTIEELNNLCEESGLEIISYCTKRSWTWLSEHETNLIKDLINNKNRKSSKDKKNLNENREDNIFHISKKKI